MTIFRKFRKFVRKRAICPTFSNFLKCSRCKRLKLAGNDVLPVWKSLPEKKKKLGERTTTALTQSDPARTNAARQTRAAAARGAGAITPPAWD